MPLLTLTDIHLHYGQRDLLAGVDLSLYRGKRIGVLGRNGEGKTSLLRIIAGDIVPDGGVRWVRPGVEIARLSQELPDADEQTVYDWVSGGLARCGELLSRYHSLTQQPAPNLQELAEIQQRLEAEDGWGMGQRVETVLTQLELPADVKMKTLSGGWRRRVALAQALVSDPDILLLDEPTNHLDIPSIEWLENQICNYRGALLLVTHDRKFLEKVCNVIVELDRGHVYPWEGDYRSFLQFRDERLANEERANALFDKRLAEEEKWIRQGIKARRTRNEGRVRALETMRHERQLRRQRQGSADFNIDSAGLSGKLVAELKHVSHSFAAQKIIDDFSTLIVRGDRLGIVGANGSGKSTLLKILLGELVPDDGDVRLGTNLEIAYFDQLRQQLDPRKNLLDNICEGRESITINGRERHGISYLGDFLFTPDRIRTPLGALSGGEQNRAILAKLFSKPANVLVLDEPTNDLDIETLELLEDILVNFDGTLLLVSHDRVFMDNIVSSILVFEGNGIISEHVGGYGDWVRNGGRLAGDAEKPAAERNKPTAPRADQKPLASKPKKLGYREQRELAGLPEEIEGLEAQVADYQQRISGKDFYRQERSTIDAAMEELGQLQARLEHCYQRWQELEQ